MPPLILSDKAHITQGDLPHWDDKKAIYFATFRLADSLPITAMKEFRAWEEDKLESLNHGNVATTAWEEFERFTSISSSYIGAFFSSLVPASAFA